MKYYSQRDKAWSGVKLGFGSTTIGNYGCFITALSMLIEKTPNITNEILKKGGAFNGDLLISDKAAVALDLEYLGKTTTKPKEFPTIAEVDMSPSAGKQQHFVVMLKDKIIDPWTGSERPLNTYPIVSYRLFKLKNEPMADNSKNVEKILKSISDFTGDDYGASPNDRETKDIIKFFDGLKEDIKAFNSDITKKNEEIERQRKEIINLNATIYNRDQDIKNKTNVIETLNNRVKDLEKVTPIEEPEETLGSHIIGIWNIIRGIK